jgi:tRNA threonylcarbamoyl adenosine modification protein (Sua5/YciO/YrdC/YwlC family)
MAVIPTDSWPALVIDVRVRDAAARLYDARRVPKGDRKPLALMVRGFGDVDAWASGFGDLFKVAKRTLPGPYTLILPASTRLRHVVDAATGKVKTRRALGVRLPAHAVAAAVLAGLDAPLLVTSASAAADGPLDAATLADTFDARGADVAYVVDAGGGAPEGGSTVLDLTVRPPAVVRRGLGDPGPWLE